MGPGGAGCGQVGRGGARWELVGAGRNRRCQVGQVGKVSGCRCRCGQVWPGGGRWGQVRQDGARWGLVGASRGRWVQVGPGR